jgi:hypothetical protein
MVGEPGEERFVTNGKIGRRLSAAWPISKIRPGGLAFNVVRAIGAVVARFVHTEEVTGSNPVSPTNEMARSADSAGRAILLFTVV